MPHVAYSPLSIRRAHPTAVRRVCHHSQVALLVLAILAGAAPPVGAQTANSERTANGTLDLPGRSPAPGTLFLHPERFSKRDGGLAEVDRGVLFVPANRDDAESGVISIEFWRFTAAADAPAGAPPIFQLHGGPGWPGLAGSLEREGYYEERLEPFTHVSDLVVVGQRGIGSSKPNTACEGVTPHAPGAEPSLLQQAAAIREAAERCRTWWEKRGLDLHGLTVVQAAADVNDVRAALGYDRIVIWGVSFGSHWGMAVIRFHPEIVERAVLSGMEGPNHTYDSPTGILNALKRIAADAEDSPQLQGHIPDGGLVAALRETIERLESEPVSVAVESPEKERPVNVRLDGDAVRGLAKGYLGRVGERRREASWPAGVLALYRREYEAAARELAPESTGGGGGLPTASFFMLDCGSGITREREAELLADPARHVVGELGWFYRSACPAWDADLGDAFRGNFDTQIPTVIVHGNWDLSTPLENALEVAPHFKNGKLVLVERGSHGALGEALEEFEWFRDALHRFAASGDMSGIPETIELPEPDWVVPGQEGTATGAPANAS